MKRYFWEMFFGFAAAVVLGLGPPIAFLMLPAAGFFLLLVPIWSIGVVGLLFVLFLIFGRIPAAIGVALLAIAVALSPFGILAVGAVAVVRQYVELNEHIEAGLEEKCATGYVALKKPSAKPDRLVIDSIELRGEQNYDVADTVAVLTGMRVVEINRVGLDLRFNEAWETTAEHSNACVGEHASAELGVTPRGSQRKIAPFAVDMCLRRTKIPDPLRDLTPAIVLRGKGVALDCLAIEVVERTESGDVELGRLHYDSYHKRFYPKLAPPEGVPQASWQLVLLSEVLQKDLGDKALMGHAVAATK